jgi:hypothetical protein
MKRGCLETWIAFLDIRFSTTITKYCWCVIFGGSADFLMRFRKGRIKKWEFANNLAGLLYVYFKIWTYEKQRYVLKFKKAFYEKNCLLFVLTHLHARICIENHAFSFGRNVYSHHAFIQVVHHFILPCLFTFMMSYKYSWATRNPTALNVNCGQLLKS